SYRITGVPRVPVFATDDAARMGGTPVIRFWFLTPTALKVMIHVRCRTDNSNVPGFPGPSPFVGAAAGIGAQSLVGLEPRCRRIVPATRPQVVGGCLPQSGENARDGRAGQTYGGSQR